MLHAIIRHRWLWILPIVPGLALIALSLLGPGWVSQTWTKLLFWQDPGLARNTAASGTILAYNLANGLLPSLLTLGALLVGVPIALDQYLQEHLPGRELSEFKDVRIDLANQRGYLSHLASRLYPKNAHPFDNIGPVIANPDWLRPSTLQLWGWRPAVFEATPSQADCVDSLSSLWPVRSGGLAYRSYSETRQAIGDLTAENRISYRLNAILPDRKSGPLLRFSAGHYLEHMDHGEAIGYELARSRKVRALLRFKGRKTGPLRGLAWLLAWLLLPKRRLAMRHICGRRLAWLFGDCVPTTIDRSDWPIYCGVNALVLLTSPGGDDPRFILHKRTNVSTAEGTVHVTPAGEFQPASESPDRLRLDCDVVKCFVREFAEELLGADEAPQGRALDYGTHQYGLVTQGLRDGKLSLSMLGFALDALTLKGEILLVANVEPVWFRTARMACGVAADANIEGPILSGTGVDAARPGIRYTREVVAQLINDYGTLPAGAACIALAALQTPPTPS